uniref:Adaptor protein, phosphotyrosine interaction, PH domain and leucine zipper containing 2 n=1 Tax=Gadus morhua TaxID=8049 RepID=A0A8C4ZBD5_GADMO
MAQAIYLSSWLYRCMHAFLIHTDPEGARKSLKKRAYGALLSKLFQPGTCKGSATGPATTPPRNKVLMISFDLRVAGCQEEAERLEELLGTLPEGEPSDPVLELLVHLAGSAAPPPTSFSRDYMRRERPVLRRPPLEGYQSKELQRLEARAWGLVCSEEWGSLGGLCGTLGLMDALPGTGLQALRMKLEVEERFEKDTRLTLFGALQHTRTSDLHIKLDLPPVPSDADVTGLAIKVPHCFDQSEDEGFQSASNLTPDSQSVPSPCPEFDIWEALGSFEPGKRRCWESVGCPPGNRELPYVTEGGREAFDQLYRLWEGQMRVVSTVETPSPILPLPLDSQTQLVSDLLNVLIGVESTTFPLTQSVQFNVRPGVCVSGTSPESMSRLLGELAQYGTHYLRLSHFSRQTATKRGLVFQAFTGGLRKYLHYYRACVLSTPPTLSLLTIGFHFRKVGRQLRYLSELCCVDGPSGVGQATFPVGVKMLSYLYNEAQSNCSNENYPVLLSLLKSSCEPYTRFVSDWVYSGVFRDVHSEFMIQVNEDYLSFRDKHFWQRGYTLISKDVEDFVPVFLRHIANDVYVCGKTINLLKICCPQHYICWSELPTPRISVTFSLQEVEEIERDCAVYRGRVEMIAKHSATSREEQVLQLTSLEEAKKRERFEELKQHLEQEQEWRSAARRKEQEDDFSFTRELRDREQRLQVLEEQLEQRARNELIAQYGRLSEDAARRERRALWRVQRMRLDPARAQFLTSDEEKIEVSFGQLSQNGLLYEHCDSPRHLFSFFAEHTGEISLGAGETSHWIPFSCLPDGKATDCPATKTGVIPVIVVVVIEICRHASPGLGELGSDLQQQPPAAVDYDFSAPFRPLEGITGQAPPPPTPAVLPDMAAVPHPSASHIAVGENVSDVQASVPRSSIHGQASASSFPTGQYTLEGGAPDAPKRSVHGHPSESFNVGESDGIVPLPSQNPHGHASDSRLQAGALVSDDAVPFPAPSTHGHASDSQLTVGARISDDTVPFPSPGAHGHSSDAHIQVGENISDFVALLPAPGAHGHTSDCTLQTGCVVSGTEPRPGSLPGGPQGHSSDPQLAAGALQDYLLSLAVQYEVETYEDCSNRMSASPECQLLKRLAGGPRGLPADPTLQSATDTTSIQLSEMVSLPVLMKHSVTGPLITHMSLVNKAVVDYFFVELGVERHFEALRHFLLMEDGEFAQSLGDLLFEKLGSGQTPGELLTPLVLNSILSKALQYSLHGDIRQAANFTFALRFLPDTFHPHAPDSLNCLELRYKVDWPLNIIITDGCMNKYNRLFSFLLQLKHMVWSLRDVWFHLKRTALVKGAGHSVQFRQLQLYRHEMQHFVKVIQGYIANQILQVSWSEFTAKLATAGDLDAIHRMHADYLNRAIFRGLLTEKAAPVMNIIHSIFSLILKFRAQLIAQPWSSHQGETVHPSFIAMQQSYNTFKYYSHFLFKVVTKLVNRGYQPHLEDFLLRINFNNYYKET